MSKGNGVLVPFVLFLVSTSLFSPRSLASGSPGTGDRSGCGRPDPSRHFKCYYGGYDLQNKHYWASAAFTGVHGYVIAGAWMLSGLGFGIFILSKGASTSSTDPSDLQRVVVISLMLLLTLLAIVASGCVLAANQRSHHRMRRLKETILKAGDDAHRTIRRIITTMMGMEYLLLPYEPAVSFRLNLTTHQLRKESRVIEQFVQTNGRSIDLAIQTSYIAHIVIVAVNMVLLTGVIVLLLLHWHPGLVMIILFCWILTTLCWVITGIDFFLHTFAEDTCSAFQGYVQNPKKNSLTTILPCMDSSYSDQLMTEIGSTIYNFFALLNAKTTVLYRSLGIGDLGNELTGVLKICEPFSGPPNYSYMPGNCSKDDIPVGDLPNVLAPFTCYQGNSPGKCKSEGKFVPESAYYMACAYSRSIQGLIDMYPDLKGLSECSFVKDRFEEAVLHQCRPFRASTRRLWSSMLALSIVMVALVLAWVVKACQDRGRAFSRCSIFPNS
ncbi:LOW QUALITY PROTEIN: uncharacterized protein LOC115747066 [Rhodamnia argentea]|uniref:LOW QUALITY PROTEIN: uncharacterized protein LOC115747066 n=1 Tax=Rhodamnia argentea TaxID=178133 RepID=A0A8B8PW05_9MYRT|nr:LOW QUALITY PROTEIN: uncharacterized protein LOC115747066 [Rhodamnia argentea]